MVPLALKIGLSHSFLMEKDKNFGGVLSRRGNGDRRILVFECALVFLSNFELFLKFIYDIVGDEIAQKALFFNECMIFSLQLPWQQLNKKMKIFPFLNFTSFF